MQVSAERWDARPRSDQHVEELFGDGFPAFITADQLVKQHIGAVRELFGDLELVLVEPDGVLVAAGWGVPISWDGDPATLPEGYTDTVVHSVEGHRRGTPPDTLVIMAAQVHPQRRGQGLAAELLMALRAVAAERQWSRVVAPVRPTLKARYPMTPIDRFASWVGQDGAPLDPWLRTHHRLGARVVATAPCSQTMTGTVTQWEEWTGLALPESGDYVIPDGLSLLNVDRDRDIGTYVEPNVWVQHV